MNRAVSQPDITEIDRRWMRAAIAQSLHAQGRTDSNPPVGCVIIDKGGRLCAVAHTGSGGAPHAETTALKLAGAQARGGTVYVTLEPCAHHGKTPPCAAALIDAKVGRVVVAVRDPDSRVDGRGIAMLEAAGIEVVTHVETAAAAAVLAGFLHRIKHSKPYVSLKTAASLDGRIALSDGKKRWLTGAQMRQFVHELRSRHDALMTGVGTVIADDPQFTCRGQLAAADSPAVYVLDSALRTPLSASLLKVANRSVTLFCTSSAPQARHKALQSAGAQIVTLPADADGHVDIIAAMSHLGAAGVNNLMVEAGVGVTSAIYKHDIAEQIFWTQSPHLLGADALPVIGALKLVALPLQTHYTQTEDIMIGADHLRVFVKSAAAA